MKQIETDKSSANNFFRSYIFSWLKFYMQRIMKLTFIYDLINIKTFTNKVQ